MTAIDPTRLRSASAIAAAVRSGELNARDVAASALSTLDSWEPRLHALLSCDREQVLREADALSDEAKQGPLAGVPIVVKDNIQVSGHSLTCASKILEGYRSTFDATCIARLKQAGAIVLGKANLDEFAMGSSCEHSAYGPTRNPWDTDRVPGGSSGGSAASVAAGYAPISLGSDTGGSIRQPAALSGCVGLKPSYGAVSRYGLVAFASSLDQIGPFANSVQDAALCLDVMAGPCGMDSTVRQSAWQPITPTLRKDASELKGKRIGWVPSHLGEGCAPDVAASVRESLKRLQAAGAELVELDFSYAKYVVHVYYILATSEASSNLARFDGVRYGLRREAESLTEQYSASRGAGFGPEVQRRIMLGTFALSSGYQDAYYKRARKVQELISQEYARAFERCDLVLGPTSPSTAFKLGEKQDDPLSMYLCDVYTIGANLAGLPALSMPCGYDSAGLPIGLHLQAPRWHDAELCRAASAMEALLDPVRWPNA